MSKKIGIAFFVGVCLLPALFVNSQTNAPTPPSDDPPTFPGGYVPVTNETGSVTLYKEIDPKAWALSFVWVGDLKDLGSTNEVVYPIEIVVPFQHEGGFVFIRGEAR